MKQPACRRTTKIPVFHPPRASHVWNGEKPKGHGHATDEQLELKLHTFEPREQAEKDNRKSEGKKKMQWTQASPPPFFFLFFPLHIIITIFLISARVCCFRLLLR